MMFYLVLLMAVLFPMLLAAAFLLGRHLHRKQSQEEELSPVSRQHIDLFQGGQLNEAAVASAKEHFRNLLEHGQVQEVEASLRPGVHYVIQVRALAEIGTDDVGRILERQLNRRLTEDQIEQSWYWIDLASSLRSLNREQSLPHLLRCSESAGEIPLGHFFAAETVCFLTFAGYLREPESPLGKAALRVLHRALEGLRFGVQPQVVAEARMGEAIEHLWDNRPETVQPLVVRVFAEALRHLRRAPHVERLLAEDTSEQEAYKWQISRLASMEHGLEDYVEEAVLFLRQALPRAAAPDQRDILSALNDLRADAAPEILPLLATGNFAPAEQAVEVLAWSHEPAVAEALRSWTARRVPMDSRAMKRPISSSPRRRSVPGEFPYRAIIRTLRHHPSAETEAFLLLAASDWDPAYRGAAISSLGWWEPVDRQQVLRCLQKTRRDPSAEVRQSTRAALARLGERQSLHWFRQALQAEDSQSLHEAIQVVANEALTLLWPDLDVLVDADDKDVAHHASEALERLAEDREWRHRDRS